MYKEFKDLKITTMTLVISLNGSINLKETFSTLPITRIELPQRKRVLKKFKIPHHDVPGSILSMRYAGYTRGVVRSSGKKWFKNSITIDMSVKEKNLSLKVSNTKIQMCGASSDEQALEGANRLIQKIFLVQEEIDYIKQNKDKALEIVEYIAENFRGDLISFTNDDSNSERSEEEDDRYDLVIPEDVSHITTIDERISSFIMSFVNEFVCYNDFISTCRWFMEIDRLCSPDLGIERINKAMVNYNYDIGFKIDRYNLAANICDLNGFKARYLNTAEYNVTITLPIKDVNSQKKKSKVPCHTFMVYQSGLVTQSGPGNQEMEDAYVLFNQTIFSIKDKIISQ